MDVELQLSDWLELDQSKPLRLEKEVLYADKFEKRDGKGNLEYKFEITPSILDHLALSVDVQLQNEVEIPYAAKHLGWELAENRWGDVVGKRRGKNRFGKEALFLAIEFKDEEAMKVGKRSNVSVGIPPLSYDGLGRKYTNPLRHLAATSAPVVPGLSPWQAIAASFESSDFQPIIGDLAMPFPPPKKDKETGDEGQPPVEEGAEGEEEQVAEGDGAPSDGGGEGTVNVWDMILQVMELQVPPGASDDAKGVAVLTGLQMLKGKRTMAQQPQPGQAQPNMPGAPKNQPGGVAGGGISLSQEASPLFVDTIRKNRELMLSQLVHSNALDANAAKELLDLYASPEHIGVELSQGSDGGQFNSLLAIIAKNKPVAATGRTAGSELPDGEVLLGHDGHNTGLAAAVDKRVEAAK